MDPALLARQLVRALRGRRSQAALSRRLGFRTNVLYAWEGGRNWPTAAQTLGLAAHSRIDLHQVLRGFYRVPPHWLDQHKQLATPEAVLAFLSDLRGSTPLAELARSSGLSRFSLSRIYKGQAQPKLPEFLLLIHVCTRRLLDFVSLLAAPDALPSVAPLWRKQQARREAATRVPWSPAVRCAVELEDYRRLPRHREGWLAARLHVEPDVEQQAIALLTESDQVRWSGRHYASSEEDATELSEDKAQARARRAFWGKVATERALRGDGMSAYNVCGVSRDDLKRLKDLQREYLARARAIIAESRPVECVALLQVHVLDLTVVRDSEE